MGGGGRAPAGARPVTATHHEWDASLEPVAVVRPGEALEFVCPRGGDPAMREDSTLAEIDLDAFVFHLVGPVWIEGARPGDTLEVEVLGVEPDDWGFTMIVPGLGLLPDDFAEPYLTVWDLRDGTRARLADGVSVPLAPFLGTLGVQPDAGAPRSPLPPHRGGGNVDNRSLVAGSRLWLPVWCEGARFSCGDAHGAQGDGEVCISAIECAATATLRFSLHRRTIAAPRFEAPAGASRSAAVHATMGIADDLMEGARIATRAMLDWLEEERGLAREDAYVLLSVAGDLRILEVVDAGVWNVAMALPLDVFDGELDSDSDGSLVGEASI